MSHSPPASANIQFPNSLETHEERAGLLYQLQLLQFSIDARLGIETGFTARSTQTTAYSSGTAATVPFSDELIDESGRFNISDEKYYAPIRGLYSFTSSLSFDNTATASKEWSLRLETPSKTYRHHFYTPTVAEAYTVNINWPLVFLDVDEAAYLTIARDSVSGTVTMDGDAGANWFSGFLQQVY